MAIIRERENVNPNEILFIDDAFSHLKDVKKSGVQLVLASWGYTTNKEIQEAEKLGILVLDKKNISSLFTTDNQKEVFDVVDENDKIIGKTTRKEVHSKGLWHRAVHILILNSKGELLLQKRSMNKDLYKGYWIDAAAGHLGSGDTYEAAAKRELEEELGISVDLEKLLVFRKPAEKDNEFICVFLGYCDGPFKVNKDEVNFVKFFKPKDILEMMKKEKFTPATIKIFDEIRKCPELLKRLRLS